MVDGALKIWGRNKAFWRDIRPFSSPSSFLENETDGDAFRLSFYAVVVHMISVLAQNAHAHSYDVIVSLMIYQFILVSLTIVSLHAVVLQPAAFASITTTNLNKNMPVSFSSSTRTTAVSAVHVPVSSSQQQNENFEGLYLVVNINRDTLSQWLGEKEENENCST